ncbi:MAG: SDR family NAD(P)-dependent oxidoreductase [Chloroflexi bacterium]|nr:SDR family NAD(P)-dependent oxidoreductase [Chloroflexota bacterium]
MLTNRIALVTGASRGIGRAIAIEMAQRGASVALVARGADALAETVENIRAGGGRAAAFPCDLRVAKSVDRLRGEIEASFGPVQVLVNASGIFGPIAPIAHVDADAWEETIQVNLISPLRLCRAFVGPMLERGFGRVINVSSAAALHTPGTDTSAYAASKLALNHVTRFLANEVAGRGVTANAIHPGDVKTAMWADIRDQTEHGDAVRLEGYRSWVRTVEQGGDAPEASAHLAAWLASDDAAHMNGQFVWIRGGLQSPFAAWGDEVFVSPE